MRVHFVFPSQYADQIDEISQMVPGLDYPYWLGGAFNWPALSYLSLRKYAEGLTLGVDPIPGVMNFAHSTTWRSLNSRSGEFRISVRADYPRLFDVDFEILQNPAMDRNSHQAYLPYWPVPGILPRHPDRKSIRNIAYAGRTANNNLERGIREGALSSVSGVRFRVIEPNRWHDLREIDLLIAIRRFGKDRYLNKPPSKLFMSWISGIPLIAGFDSAFSSVGNPGMDYVRVTNLDECRREIENLADSRTYYDRIVAGGKMALEQNSEDRIAEFWLTALRGQISERYQNWLERSGSEKRPIFYPMLDRLRGVGGQLKSTATSYARHRK